MNSRISWQQVKSFLILNSLFTLVLAAPAWAFPTELDFDAPVPNTVPDGDAMGQGTGFTSVQKNSTNTEYNLGQGIDLIPSSSFLQLDILQGSNSGSTNTLKNGLQVAINSQSQPFTIRTRLKGPLNALTTASQQGGIFLGSDQDNYVKLVFIRTNTNQWGLQFLRNIRN